MQNALIYSPFFANIGAFGESFLYMAMFFEILCVVTFDITTD